MEQIVYYFLQVILYSGLLFFYYFIFLRNEKFHQYNRFYLLSIAVLSWLIPFFRIHTEFFVQDKSQVYRLLSVVSENNVLLEDVIQSRSMSDTWVDPLKVLLLLICFLFMFRFIVALFRIYRMMSECEHNLVNGVRVFYSRDPGTPFSFFRNIFWNPEIDLKSSSGKKIFQHELAHVFQWHTLDKIVMQLMLVVGWANPFFWFVRKELDLIHEFIADRHAVSEGDASSLATMMLAASYPQQHFIIANHFYFSSIKRRIFMITNNAKTRFTYFKRIVILPLAFFAAILLSFRWKEGKTAVKLDKTYTVVLDAGHGGFDKGASLKTGMSESKINLEVVRKMQALNFNPAIRIVLTRDKDEMMDPKQRANFVNSISPDLFLSVHVDNKGKLTKPASDVFISSNSQHHSFNENQLFGSILVTEFLRMGISSSLRSRSKPIWILESTKIPSAVAYIGNISSPEQFAAMQTNEYQERMARVLLTAIEQFLAQKK